MRRFLLVGWDGFGQRSAEVVIDCVPWTQVSQLPNVSDYESVAFNVLAPVPRGVNWRLFFDTVDPEAIARVIFHGGEVHVFGDPRFEVSTGQSQFKTAFLSWTGLHYAWERVSGESVEPGDPALYGQYEWYLAGLRRWNYTLASSSASNSWGRILGVTEKNGHSVKVTQENIAKTRYGHAIASRHIVSLVGRDGRSIKQSSPIVLLPPSTHGPDEALQKLFEIRYSIPLGPPPEPSWAREIRIPDQIALDENIEAKSASIDALAAEISELQHQRAMVREPISLLYASGEALERLVRTVLTELGAQVEAPIRSGEEDGWITVVVGGQTYEGVLEIKATKRETFDEYGLKQLAQWHSQGVISRDKDYKKIFVGLAGAELAPSARPVPYHNGWRRRAATLGVAAINTEDLFRACALRRIGRLDVDAFWVTLFSTCGVFDGALLRNDYEASVQRRDNPWAVRQG